MNRLKYLATHLKKACEDLKMDCPYLNQDNRMGGYMACTNIWIWKDNKKQFYVIRYNMKELAKARKVDILTLIYHELGHIKFEHLKNNTISLDVAEYEAEAFALENVEKYYPKYYQTALSSLKIYKDCKHKEYRKFYDLYKEKSGTHE